MKVPKIDSFTNEDPKIDLLFRRSLFPNTTNISKKFYYFDLFSEKFYLYMTVKICYNQKFMSKDFFRKQPGSRVFSDINENLDYHIYIR